MDNIDLLSHLDPRDYLGDSDEWDEYDEVEELDEYGKMYIEDKDAIDWDFI